MYSFFQKVTDVQLDIALWSMFGGLFLLFIILELFAPRHHKAYGRRNIEASIYYSTIMALVAHILLLLIIGSWQFRIWYNQRGPMEQFWDGLPLIVIYLGCIALDLFIMLYIFNPTFRRYR